MNTVDLEQFFGRQATLEVLKRRVFDLKDGYRQNVAFLGGRYNGKTSILLKFLSQLNDPQIYPVYLNFEHCELGYLFEKIVGNLLHQYCRNNNVSPAGDLNLLIHQTEGRLPETIKQVKKIQAHLQHSRQAEAYQGMIGLPQVFAFEAQVFCVLVFDEFHGLELLGIKNEFQELGKKIMTQQRCLYVMASSLPWTAQKILSEKLSLLFGNFEVIEVQPFDTKTSMDFVRHQLGALKVSDHLLLFTADFTGGQPLYLSLICQELKILCALHRQQEIYLPALSGVLEDILGKRWGILNRHFELMVEHIASGKVQSAAVQLLLLLAQGRKKMSELKDHLGARQTIVTQGISRLLETGMIAKNGNYYYLPDKLLKYWLKYVFQKRRHMINQTADEVQRQFREELQGSYEQFCAGARKEMSVQVIELFSCFEDEPVLINGRRYKLPAFHSMTPMDVPSEHGGLLKLIKAATREGEWAIIVKSGLLAEADIAVISDESRKAVHKPQRCVLISGEPIDEHARVRALQERMWIWDEGDLSTLSVIFERSVILKGHLSTEKL